MPKKLTTKEFIRRAKQIHGSKYDYSKVEYINNNTKVCIICPVHGEFWQVPQSHLSGCGCRLCGVNDRAKKATKDVKQFIEESNIVHNDKYDYSKVNYMNNSTKVRIICPVHGEFWQTPHNHLTGAECPKCKYEKIGEKAKDTTESFIKKAMSVHGNKYDYSKVKYIDSHTKVCIICPEHGEFWQKPNNHLHGWGCAKCSGMHKKTTEEFIKQAKDVYGDRYSYENSVYTTNKHKITITCKKHGDFSIYPTDHLRGQGCPKCTISHLEEEIKTALAENNIAFIWQYSNKILGKQHLDFYLPDYKIAIECQGEQHFRPIKFFGGEQKHSIQKAWDLRKRKICEENGVLMLYYTDKKIFDTNISKTSKNTFFSKQLLIETIKARK